MFKKTPGLNEYVVQRTHCVCVSETYLEICVHKSMPCAGEHGLCFQAFCWG